jgi:hypothetical protein
MKRGHGDTRAEALRCFTTVESHCGGPAARHDATEFLFRATLASRRRGGDEVVAEREARVEVKAATKLKAWRERVACGPDE